MFTRHQIAKLLVAIFLSWSILPGKAQLKFESLTTSNGLSQGYISCILQDSEGFMWFGTKDGLNRYDGYSFRVYTFDSYNSNSISNNYINQLFEDSKGRLWVSTDDGLNLYDKNKNIFRRIVHNPANANSISGNKIFVPIVELPDGRFLVFPHEKNLDVISLPNDFLQTNAEPVITHITAPGALNVSTIYKDGQQKIWVNSDKFYELNPTDLSLVWRKDFFQFGQTAPANDSSVWTDDAYFSQVQDANAYPLFSSDISRGHGRSFLHESDKHRFWLGITDSGRLEIFDVKNWKRGSPLHPQQAKLYSFTEITPTKMYKDHSGLVWVGTNGYGLRKYTNDSEKFLHVDQGHSVRKIMALPNGNMYVKGWGDLKKFDSAGNNLSGNEEKKMFLSRDFFIGNQYILWGLQRRYSQPEAKYAAVVEKLNLQTNESTQYRINITREEEICEPILEDSKGHVWLTGFGGRLIVLDPVSKSYTKFSINTNRVMPMLKSAQITTLYEDASGTLWAGTETGLAKISFTFASGTAAKITWYKTNALQRTALNYNHISCILTDPLNENLLWVATKGGGLNQLNLATGQFTHITTNEGLCNNVVYGLLADEAGNIWGSTNNGIFCLLKQRTDDQGKWMFRHFTKALGLQDDEFNTGAFARLSNNKLAFGGVNGINIFNPATVLQSGYTPNVFITSILIGNKAVLPHDETGILQQVIEKTSSISLNHQQDILTLEFSSLDYEAPGENKYRYQMVGIDKAWVESGNRRNATYLHLPPGRYSFKVQGSNSEGTWSPRIAVLTIIVHPPWWRSWWAYLLYIFLAGFLIRAYLLFRINKAKLHTQLNFEKQEAKRVKELDAVKTKLYANITHEFRTPLTVILGMANQVKSNPEKYIQHGLDMIVRNGNNLLKLVNEMLDLSKVEDGKMGLNLTGGDIVAFLRYIVESFQSLANGQHKNIHFLADTDEMIVSYDAEKMRQIISNLLSNAIKFTESNGHIYVHVSQRQAESNDTAELVLKVKDTGMGIPESQLPHIFDRFYQVDNSSTRHAEGTGIGLALTKELVKLMNGTITVKSPPVGAHRGTEFAVSFSFNRVNETVEAEPNNNVQYSAVEATIASDEMVYSMNETEDNSPLILLVEDNIDVVAYTASCLPRYKLSVGKDGKEGFDIAVETIPDLIITDVMMPFIDGFEMCRKLRHDERTSHIPIIMLTAKADIQSKLEGIEKGADVYLEKPFNKEELLLRIKKLLEQRKYLQQYYSRQIGIGSHSTKGLAAGEALGEKTSEDEFVRKVREIVQENFTNYQFNVDQLCKKIFMSHSQLHRKLEALTNCSPNKFIRLVRLQQSKDLLKNPALSIASIALDCGYIDPGYFSRVFKQEYGLTPQEWRLQNQHGSGSHC